MRRLVWLLVLVVIIAGGLLYVRANRVDPTKVTAEEYRKIATEFDGGSFAALPAVKKIEVKPTNDDPLYYIKYYARLMFNRTSEGQAYFDPKQDTIHIIGDQSCLEATLPEWMRPTLKHTIRHEYGHAFLSDWLEACEPRKDPVGEYLAYTDTAQPNAAACPPRLKIVMDEYTRVPQDVYEQPYYTRTFNEYMAESYARFVAGQYVPVETRAFLAEVAKSGVVQQ